jgi:hypothetical protein
MKEGVNFTNILKKASSYKIHKSSSFILTFRFLIFWHKNFGAKAVQKIKVTLTLGLIKYKVNINKEF